MAMDHQYLATPRSLRLLRLHLFLREEMLPHESGA